MAESAEARNWASGVIPASDQQRPYRRVTGFHRREQYSRTCCAAGWHEGL